MTMTPFQQLIRSRRSIRRYIPQPVERDKILACLDAARIAPSASNSQTWRFLVIDDPDLKARFHPFPKSPSRPLGKCWLGLIVADQEDRCSARGPPGVRLFYRNWLPGASEIGTRILSSYSS